MKEKLKINLILFRHGLAGDRQDFKVKCDQPDSERPLTQYGRQQVRRVTKKLRAHLSNFRSIHYSPYKRAEQTAKVIAAQSPEAELRASNYLKPGVTAPSQFKKLMTSLLVEALENKDELEYTALLVGHEPALSVLLSFILTGRTIVISDIKKAGFAWVQMHISSNRKYKAKLKCLVSPKLLKI